MRRITKEMLEAIERDGFFVVPQEYVLIGDVQYRDGVPHMIFVRDIRGSVFHNGQPGKWRTLPKGETDPNSVLKTEG